MPVDSIFGVLKSLVRPKFSATTVANGYTVEEPTMLICSRAVTSAANSNAATGSRAAVDVPRFIIVLFVQVG